MDSQNAPKLDLGPVAKQIEHYDLVVIGAGIAGLNVLHAASLYLPPTARVLLIDAKSRPGGMWTMAYDYVRVHQPHPLLTVGSLRWKWRKPSNYLARRDDVQWHLANCLETLRGRFELEERFGHNARHVTEVLREDKWIAEIDIYRTGSTDTPIKVLADRVVHAAGYNYVAQDPMSLSSRNVESITPEDLSSTLTKNHSAPIYVVGGGKTGMDTVLAILNHSSGRKVTLINGAGTYFMNRDIFFPTGIRRWTGGAMPSDAFRECALMFDGNNDEDVCRHFIANYAVDSDPKNKNFVYGILSEEENKRIEAGLHDKIWGYLDDVVDGPDGLAMRMRSGELHPVEEGSIFVNCTGSILRGGSTGDRLPCLSAHDTILSINTHQAVHFLTTYSSFILANLFFDGKLRKAGLYLLDIEALLGKDKHAFFATTLVHSYHNLIKGLGSLSPSARKHFGMDLNRWFPLPRRVFGLLGIRKSIRDDRRHCRKSLDAVVDRLHIDGGPLE